MKKKVAKKSSVKKVAGSGVKKAARKKTSASMTRESATPASKRAMSNERRGGKDASVAQSSGAGRSRAVDGSAVSSPDTLGGISSEAVLKATGKGWSEWLAVIDGAGGAELTHAQIAAMLHEKLGVAGWWSQMVTVGYEQARGRRVKHQKPGGYEISVSRTIGVRVEEAFEAWADDGRRWSWLSERGFEVRKATPHKYVRGTWVDGKTELAVNFYEKGASKCQVTAQHAKIGSAKEAGAFKELWGQRLETFKAWLEG